MVGRRPPSIEAAHSLCAEQECSKCGSRKANPFEMELSTISTSCSKPLPHYAFPRSCAIAAGRTVKSDLAHLSFPQTSVTCRRIKQRVDAAVCGALAFVESLVVQAHCSTLLRPVISASAKANADAVQAKVRCGALLTCSRAPSKDLRRQSVANRGAVLRALIWRGMLDDRSQRLGYWQIRWRRSLNHSTGTTAGKSSCQGGRTAVLLLCKRDETKRAANEFAHWTSTRSGHSFSSTDTLLRCTDATPLHRQAAAVHPCARFRKSLALIARCAVVGSEARGEGTLVAAVDLTLQRFILSTGCTTSRTCTMAAADLVRENHEVANNAIHISSVPLESLPA